MLQNQDEKVRELGSARVFVGDELTSSKNEKFYGRFRSNATFPFTPIWQKRLMQSAALSHICMVMACPLTRVCQSRMMSPCTPLVVL
eukprot:g60779.t1